MSTPPPERPPGPMPAERLRAGRAAAGGGVDDPPVGTAEAAGATG